MLGKTVKESAILLVLALLIAIIVFGLVREFCLMVWNLFT